DPDPRGLLSAREALAVELQCEPNDLLLTSSTSEAYSFLFKLLCDPGDEVLVPVPSYPLFEYLARFEGVTAKPYPLSFDGSWYLDLAQVRAAMSPRTRAVVVVSPNNPTGHFLKSAELELLAGLGLPLISDEVFASYPLNAPADAAASALQAEHALVFVLSGLSKLAGLPQMKLAWTTVSGPAELANEAMSRLEMLADAYLSPGVPVQAALPVLLRARGMTEQAISARLLCNLRTLERALEGCAADALPVEGGWYAVVRLPRVVSEEDWVIGLLRHTQVLVQPGYFFDFPDEAYVVVSLLTPPDAFEQGVARLAGYVDELCR
ncbi:MAG TPA: pyridoxal phosphate-dependent aminotransferase, partial [Polyangiaceae bacterium]|nr:pyridoxal phosphate-dependent aminotransferase [Polyangiaceae bacterium]